MNQIEIAKLIISQNGNCADALCDNCPAEKTRQKLNLNSCNDIWGGDNDEYCKKWFENWLKENEKEDKMSGKIQMTEEQAREFCDDIGFSDKGTVIYLMKKRGYIRKSELQQKVEEAEKYFTEWKNYRIGEIITYGGEAELVNFIYETMQLLKQSHPEFKK
jgi:undecaprenyl pyrophosphate synthase